MAEKKVVSLGEEYVVASMPTAPAGVERLSGRLMWIGPAFIMAGLEVGTGELIMGSRAGAIVGPVLAWTIILSALFKTVNDELSCRYVAATGESPLRMWERVHPAFHTFWWIQNAVRHWMFWPAGAYLSIAGIFVAKEAFGVTGVQPWVIGGLFALLSLFVLTVAKRAYGILEKITMVSAMLMFFGMMLVCIALATPARIAEFAVGCVSFGYIPAGQSLLAISLLGWAYGGGPEESQKYGLYAREKGYGVASTVGKITGIRIAAETVVIKGVQPATDPESLKNWKLWLKTMQTDVYGVYLPLALFGALGFIFSGSYILKPAGLVPAGWMVAVVQGAYFAKFVGSWGWWLFLVLTILNIWDTACACHDSYARMMASSLRINVLTRFPKSSLAQKSERWWWIVCLIAYWILIFPAMLGIGQPLLLLLFDSYISVVVMALAFFTAIYINQRALPKEYRPGTIRIIIMTAGIIFYTIFAYITIAGLLGYKVI